MNAFKEEWMEERMEGGRDGEEWMDCVIDLCNWFGCDNITLFSSTDPIFVFQGSFSFQKRHSLPLCKPI